MTGSTVSIRLRAYRGEQHDTTECFNGLRDEAADLIDSLIAERDRLRAELAKHQESEFHPDWSMLEATRASLREHMEIIRGLRAELAFATQERNAYQDAVDVACEERDRLRELLREAREGVELIGCSEEGWDQTIAFRERLLEKIDAALAAKEKP